MDVLPYLLLPLAGPEELTEEENEGERNPEVIRPSSPGSPRPIVMLVLPGLPVDLQYLPEDKKREEDPDIRKMVLETLLLVQERPLLTGTGDAFALKPPLLPCLVLCSSQQPNLAARLLKKRMFTPS